MTDKKKRKPKFSVECDDEAERQQFHDGAQADKMTLKDWVKYKCLGKKSKRRVPTKRQDDIHEALGKLQEIYEWVMVQDFPIDWKIETLEGIHKVAKILDKEYGDS